MATGLYLQHLPPRKPTTEQETLNRIRTWIICFNLDKLAATQFGKQSNVKED